MVKHSNKKPKVSIIVPIYNVERYLRKCIDSILNQTLKDIEVILIDDGSPDNCGAIIDDYAKIDKRVVAIHQENRGYSKTVNYGIEIARGEYIGVIESDDFIETDMYEALFDSAKKNKTDVTKGMFFIYNSLSQNGKKNVLYMNPNEVDLRFAPNGVFKAEEWPRIIGFHASLWSAIYRADFIKKIKLPETTGASYQDLPFVTEIYCKAKRITVVKRAFVHWRNDEGQGNSTSARGKKLLFMGINSKTALNILKKYKKLNALKEPFFYQVFWANYAFYNRISLKYRREYFNILAEIFSEIKDDEDFRYVYFNGYAKNHVKYFMTRGGFYKCLIKESMHKAKFRLIEIAKVLLPSYKTMRFLKDQNMDILQQNELFMSEILALRHEINQLSKKK